MENKGLSIQELESLLIEKRREENQRLKAERYEYEMGRNKKIETQISRAILLHDQISDFKQYSVDDLSDFRKMAEKYGDIRSNSKGGFSIRHSVTGDMISFDRNVVYEYDERASLAVELIKEFLEDKVKKKDLPTYRTIVVLMSKNKDGDLIPAQVNKLLTIRDNYDDERWVRAMRLFEESYRVREISYSVSFFRKDVMGKDKAISLSFASIPVNYLPPIETPE